MRKRTAANWIAFLSLTVLLDTGVWEMTSNPWVLWTAAVVIGLGASWLTDRLWGVE